MMTLQRNVKQQTQANDLEQLTSPTVRLSQEVVILLLVDRFTMCKGTTTNLNFVCWSVHEIHERLPS